MSDWFSDDVVLVLNCLSSNSPMNLQIALVIMLGPLAGKKYSFGTPGIYKIGRKEGLDIAFPNSSEYHNISRHHCDLQVLDVTPPQLIITDRNSRNGTFVDGHQIIGSSEVLPNQVIVLGDVSVKVKLLDMNLPDRAIPSLPLAEATTISVQPQAPVSFLKKIRTLISDFFFPPVTDDTKTILLPTLEEAPSLQFPDYKLGDLLGRGAVSEVYLATHQESGHQVALKTLQLETSKQAETVQKFICETEYTRVLDHPHIIKLLDFNYAQDALFYTTEYCEGGSLFGLMQQLGGRLPENLAKDVIIQILEGLEYLHQVEVPYIRLTGGGFGKGHGLVHRNLNPKNILLTTVAGKLIVKISDFTTSQALNLIGMSGQLQSNVKVAGNFHFIPRSQLVFKKANPAADIWSAAACLYKMLTGYPPRDFDDRYPIAVVMEKPAVPIAERVAYLPQALAILIDRALFEETNHSTYYQTVTEFKTDLLKAWAADGVMDYVNNSSRSVITNIRAISS